MELNYLGNYPDSPLGSTGKRKVGSCLLLLPGHRGSSVKRNPHPRRPSRPALGPQPPPTPAGPEAWGLRAAGPSPGLGTLPSVLAQLLQALSRLSAPHSLMQLLGRALPGAGCHHVHAHTLPACHCQAHFHRNSPQTAHHLGCSPIWQASSCTPAMP